MPQGWYGLICCICFKQLTPEECWKDNEGGIWDVCSEQCAKQAGIIE